jgi:hypothetical protein
LNGKLFEIDLTINEIIAINRWSSFGHCMTRILAR